MASLSWWKGEYGHIAPVGHVLRERLSASWIRFHSLPESKRYPDSEQEMQEIVRRATAVAGALFEIGETIYAYKSKYRQEDASASESNKIADAFAESTVAIFWANPGVVAPDEDDAFTTWGREDLWPLSFFSELIRRVANEEEQLVCLVSPKSGNIFCPYDGGIDAFPMSALARQALVFLSSWRSKRSDGL